MTATMHTIVYIGLVSSCSPGEDAVGETDECAESAMAVPVTVDVSWPLTPGEEDEPAVPVVEVAVELDVVGDVDDTLGRVANPVMR